MHGPQSTLQALRSVENISDVSRRHMARLHEDAVERYEQLAEELEAEREAIARERGVHRAREEQLQEHERVQELLKAENKALVIEVARLEARQREHAQHASDLQSENAALARAAAEAQQAIDALEAAVAAKDAQLAHVHALEERAAGMASDNTRLADDNDALRAVLEEAADEIQTGTAVREGLQQTIDELTAHVAGLEARIAELGESENDKTMQIEQLAHEVEALTTTLAADRDTPARLQSLRAELRAGRDVATCTRADLERLVEAGAAEVAGLEGLVAYLTTTLEAMRADSERGAVARARADEHARAVAEACARLDGVAAAVREAGHAALGLGRAAMDVLPALHGVHALVTLYAGLLDAHGAGDASADPRAWVARLCAFADKVASTAAAAGIKHEVCMAGGYVQASGLGSAKHMRHATQRRRSPTRTSAG
jgi:chromosome segregation ATPase